MDSGSLQYTPLNVGFGCVRSRKVACSTFRFTHCSAYEELDSEIHPQAEQLLRGTLGPSEMGTYQAMHCPFCGNNESRIIDSREAPDGVRRRRECIRCELRFTTYERVHSMPLMIAKRDGRREAFSTEKLERSLRTACAKRPLEVGAISKMVVDIENELHKLAKAEIEARVLGEMCIERLKILDRVAYIRFASVYRDFQDVDSFTKEVEALADPEVEDAGSKSQLRLIEDDVPRLAQRGRRRRARQG